MDFCKAFDTVLRARLMHRLQELREELMWGIMARNRSVTGVPRIVEGISGLFYSTIEVKQGCLLSPTLFVCMLMRSLITLTE